MSELHYDPEKRGGGASWAMLGGVVLALEFRGEETLSNSFSRAINHENPVVRNAAFLGSAALGLHLLDRLGDYDPVDRLSDAISAVGERLADYAVEEIRIP